MRLDKYLSHCLGFSRKKATQILRSKRITINNEIIKNGAFLLNKNEEIRFDGNLLNFVNEFRYFMLNKPKGFVSATKDSDYPIALDLLNEPMLNKLHLVGRLDLETTGLLLITDNGKWSHKIRSPKSRCSKVYFVTLSEKINEKTVDLFKHGIQLNDGTQTKSAELEIIDDFYVRLVLHEGRYHQVKRMFAAIGNHVLALHREKIGNLSLDIEIGKYRSLTKKEVETIFD